MKRNQAPVVRAIDLGYGRVKYTTGRDAGGGFLCGAFPSITGRAGSKRLGGGFFAERKTITVKFNNLDYEVGEDAILATGGYATRMLDMHYVRSDTYQVLMRGAIKMMNVDVIDVLVLGSPVVNFNEVRDYLRSQFVGRINLDGAKTVDVRRVIVLPQPLGGYAWFGKENNVYERIRTQMNLIADPGYFTLDWMVSRGTNFIPERSGSHPGGMSAIIRAITREIAIKENSGNLDSLFVWDNIDRYFYAGEPFTFKGRDYDLSRHVQAAKALIDNTVDALAAKVGGVHDIERIILVGGGAKHYASALRDRFSGFSIHTVENPEFANVQGFQYVGEELCGRSG